MDRLSVRLRGLAGTRTPSGIWPGAGPPKPFCRRSSRIAVAGIGTFFLVVAPTLGLGLLMRSETASEARSIHGLQTQVDALRRQAQPQPDWSVIAASAENSVVTVSTTQALGSGWVVASDASGSDVVTNLHVVADAWDAGIDQVDVGIGDLTVKGTIARVDANDDLALIHITKSLPALQRAAIRPRLAQSVMAIGAPLGLDGTVSIGVISGFRSIEGSDYIQFSAPISPGNSGGPVVDVHGVVVAVATGKFVAPGAEALSLAIPVQTVCQLAICVGGAT